MSSWSSVKLEMLSWKNQHMHLPTSCKYMKAMRAFDGDTLDQGFPRTEPSEASQTRQSALLSRLSAGFLKAMLTNLVCGMKEEKKHHTHDIQVVLSQNTGPTVNRFP